MQQEIQLNIIPFKAPVEEAEFAFYTAKQDAYVQDRHGHCHIHKDELKVEIKFSFYIRRQALINQLIKQVYQFSKMYWKCGSQQSLPLTIKYPEMDAENHTYFQQEKLSLFNQERL